MQGEQKEYVVTAAPHVDTVRFELTSNSPTNGTAVPQRDQDPAQDQGQTLRHPVPPWHPLWHHQIHKCEFTHL